MSSGYIPPEGEPGPDEILEALREAILESPRLREAPTEEVARQLVLSGYLQKEPSPTIVADMLGALKAEEQGSGTDEISEETEEGSPT